MMDWIQGQKFIELADFVYTPEIKVKGDYYNLPNTFSTVNLKKKNIVYTHTLYVDQLFELIKDLKQKFIIITHNCDKNVDGSYELPSNVIKWYSTNVNVDDPRIESIPIGLENDIWFERENKKEKMLVKLGEPRNYKNLVYMNHNVNTNPDKRELPYEIFKKKPYVTKAFGKNGSSFGFYLDNVYNHKYMICPEGNGMDTHRMWECLYMGTVPIVVKNINNWFYNDLPILYVYDWAEVNRDLLEDTWGIFQNGEWNKEMLTFEYWKNKINDGHSTG
jgi:hypothetical protein